MGDWLYWSDWETQSLEQVGKVDGSQRSTLRGSEWRALDFGAGQGSLVSSGLSAVVRGSKSLAFKAQASDKQ